MIELTSEIRDMLNATRNSMSGYQCRHFMASVIETMLGGSPTRANREFGWNRKTLTKALKEYRGKFCYIDRYHLRGRKRAEEHLTNLLEDIQELAEGFSQTDPTFRTTRQYTRLTTAKLRQQLMNEKGYTDAELPTEETLRRKLNKMGYGMKRVKKAVQ